MYIIADIEMFIIGRYDNDILFISYQNYIIFLQSTKSYYFQVNKINSESPLKFTNQEEVCFPGFPIIEFVQLFSNSELNWRFNFSHSLPFSVP